MTPRNFPPADQCSPEDLDAIADLVVRDPSASWDLAGSREHIGALCRRYQALAQDLSAVTASRDEWKRCALDAAQEHCDAAATRELERSLAAATNDRDKWEAMCKSACHQRDVLLVERDAARKTIADREDEIARVNNERQAEVNEAAAQRERADTAESIAEIFEATARAALTILARGTNAKPVDVAELVRAVDGRLSRALVRELQTSALLRVQLEKSCRRLEEIQQTDAANDRIRSAFASAVPAICDGVTVEELDRQLDAELAAHPESGPLHHARDQRDHQEDTTQ